jgi:putative DNA primase/helicase
MKRVASLSAAVTTQSVKTNGNGHASLGLIQRLDYAWERLPQELRKGGSFCLYREEQRRKVPYCSGNPAQRAAINKPGSWASFDQTERAYETFAGFDGINAVCSPEFTFVDIDDCVDGEQLSSRAREVMHALPATYWELSPSGAGLHGIFRIEGGEFRNISKEEGKGVEVYAGKHFMSCTGWQISERNAIAPVTPDQLEQFRATKTRAVSATGDGSQKISKGQRTNTLLSIAGTMRRRGLDLASIEHALRQHNAAHCSPPLEEKKIRSILKSTEKYKAAGNLLTQENKDVGNADRLLLWGGGDVRYVAAFRRWVMYDGARWPVKDREQEAVRSEAHAMIRAFGAQAFAAGEEKGIKFAADCLNSPRITNLLREAQPKATLLIAELDRDPLLVNFQNGTLEARTNKLRKHRREDHITSVLAYDYNPKAKCPKWEKFIAETFDGDRELIDFVQRALGYSLTGDTSGKCIFLAHGLKDTAKTTLLASVKTLLGDYAGRIKVESLMVERGRPIDANAQSDLADLRGKRFVMTSETGQGQRLREELVKLLSQGQGDYRAVRKYENPFSFAETWKIWIDCNHLPVVHGTDDAIWERLIVVPFAHKVPKSKQNPVLGQALIATEAEGILAWLVRGLERWRTKRLELPSSMQQQRQQWRKESDDLGQWLEEKCVVRPDARVESTPLYESCQAWRVQHGLFRESAVLFARKMKEHGFEKKEMGKDKVPNWLGVGLKVKF